MHLIPPASLVSNIICEEGQEAPHKGLNNMQGTADDVTPATPETSAVCVSLVVCELLHSTLTSVQRDQHIHILYFVNEHTEAQIRHLDRTKTTLQQIADWKFETPVLTDFSHL